MLRLKFYNKREAITDIILISIILVLLVMDFIMLIFGDVSSNNLKIFYMGVISEILLIVFKIFELLDNLKAYRLAEMLKEGDKK